MRQRFSTILAVLLLALSSLAAPAQEQPDAGGTQALIAALADADTAVRKKAADRLLQLGSEARPELVKAARSANPEQRAQAARILRELPWMTEDDPADVREILQRYGESNDLARASVIQRLYELRAAPTLLRLLNEEPSDLVRWMITYALYDYRDSDNLAAMRKLDPADDDAPALLLAGRAWVERDREKGLTFFRRAIDAETSRPSNDMGLIDFAFEQLTTAAMEKHDFEQAAALLRRQVPRDLVPRRAYRRSRRLSSASLPRLIALHEYFGPLRSFGWDCQTWSIQSSDRPQLLETMISRLSWLGFAPTMPMGLTSQLALSDRYKAGSFLALGELTPAADLELDAAAALLDGSNEQRVRIIRSFEGRGEDVQDMMAELHWRRARAAHASGDSEAADREVQRLLELTPRNTDTAIQIILWLKETRRSKEATTLFTAIYNAGRERIDDVLNKAVYRNDLAWLCARTGERLDEAVALAQQAVDEMPHVAAFLDTLAEAKYRTGARAAAIELEIKAIQLSPDSKFMKEQLERFEAGKP